MALSKEDQIRVLQLRIRINKRKLELAKAREAEGLTPQQPITQDAQQIDTMKGSVTPEIEPRPIDAPNTETGQELANRVPRARAAFEAQQNPEASEEHMRNLLDQREERVDKRTQTFGDTFTRNVFGANAATPLEAVGGASTLFLRGLGAMAQQGKFADEDTMLLKVFQKDLTDWSESREAQNTSADEMIAKLRESMNSLPEIEKVKVQAQIDKAEDDKNSGLLTSSADVVGSILLTLGSDPFVIKSLLKGIFKIGKKAGKTAIKAFNSETAKETAGKIVTKVTGESAERMQKLGLNSNKMLDFLEKQPGIDVKEKLKLLRRRQTGEISAGGKIEDASIQKVFGGENLDKLTKNVDDIQAHLDDFISTSNLNKQKLASSTVEKQGAIKAGKEAEIAKSETKNLKNKAFVEAKAEKEIADIVPDITPESIVERSINKGDIAGGGKNVGFNAAEKIEKAVPVPKEDQIKLINEALSVSEGSVKGGANFNKEATEIWDKISKTSSKTDVEKAIKATGLKKTGTSETIMRIMEGNTQAIRAGKEELDNILKKGGDLSGLTKQGASKMKASVDDVIKSNTGEDLTKVKINFQTAGGEEKLARDELWKAMGVTNADVVGNTIKKGEAIDAMDVFLNKEAEAFASNGFKPTTAMKEGGKLMEWKKHFKLDLRKEVNNRARKIDIKSGLKDKIGKIDINTSEAKKTVIDASNKATEKVRALSKLSLNQLTSNIQSRLKEIRKALSKAKTNKDIGENVSERFNSEVNYFASESGGFSRSTKSFKKFEKNYGKQLADMVEDQAIFLTFDVTPSGSITNSKKILDNFSSMKAVGASTPARTLIFAEGLINTVFKKFLPYESRLNKVMKKITTSNKELVKELKKLRKKALKKGAEDPTKEAFALLVEKSPLVTSDVLASEFKFFNPLTFMDKVTLLNVANSTGNAYTNKERMAAKRLLQKLKKKGVNITTPQ